LLNRCEGADPVSSDEWRTVIRCVDPDVGLIGSSTRVRAIAYPSAPSGRFPVRRARVLSAHAWNTAQKIAGLASVLPSWNSYESVFGKRTPGIVASENVAPTVVRRRNALYSDTTDEKSVSAGTRRPRKSDDCRNVAPR
jgi:hypothetical protein